MYVRENDSESRRELIEFLEARGYSLYESESRTGQEIIDGVFPIVVDEENKVYYMMGNVTCAVAAASSGKLVIAQEFYEKMKREHNI